MHIPAAEAWHIDVDKYTNPHTPRNRVCLLPQPIRHFLGHRHRPAKEVGNLVVAGWALLGAFAGVAVIAATFMIPAIEIHKPPIIVASFGAAAILEFNTIESPFAQPRNSILGHLLAAVVGVGINKLFKFSSNYEDLRWVAGGLGCGAASAVMTLTETIYPPAGATALLASVDSEIEQLGWYLVPLVLLSSILTLVVSLLLNNIQRRYPTYWWTPADLGNSQNRDNDIEKVPNTVPKVPPSSADSLESTVAHFEELTIKITPDRIAVPEYLYLAAEEERILEVLRDRLREGLPRRLKGP